MVRQWFGDPLWHQMAAVWSKVPAELVFGRALSQFSGEDGCLLWRGLSGIISGDKGDHLEAASCLVVTLVSQTETGKMTG